MAWSAVPSTSSRNRSSLARSSAVLSSTFRRCRNRSTNPVTLARRTTGSTFASDVPLRTDMPISSTWPDEPCRSDLCKQSVVYLLHRPVTVTGGGFQPLPVEDRELPPAVADQARFLEAARRQRHALPV